MTNKKNLNKYLSKPGFMNSKIFNKNLVALEHVNQQVKLNKPIYVGFCVLELSKHLMYDFHYGVIKKKYGNDAQLLMTDTDSLMYEIKTEDVYKDMFENKEEYDMSDIKGEYNYTGNKGILGKFKDESEGKPIREFIGLRSKMYSLKIDDNNEKQRCKGIVNSVVKTELKHITYKRILETSGKMYSKMNVIRSNKHKMYTMEINKVSLSAYDDKRWIRDDGISSYAYGHYRISKNS
jgi:hypothetical protein